MVEINVLCRGGDVDEAVRQAAALFDLIIATDGTLKLYPGSRHWHLRRPRSSGTLEVTHWPAESRLWVAYHSNRVGDGWVATLAPEFAKALGRTVSPERRD